VFVLLLIISVLVYSELFDLYMFMKEIEVVEESARLQGVFYFL